MAKRVPEALTSRAGRPWTFLTNHGHMLVSLHRHPESRIRDLAAEIGITERAVQTILAELEADGYLTKVKVGRRNEYRVHAERTFRHPAESSRPVGELLRIFDDHARP
jgi:DNA-binding MarR family transcriptional regulator